MAQMTYSEWFDSWPQELRQELIDTYMKPGPGQPPARLDSLTREDKAWLARHHAADMQNQMDRDLVLRARQGCERCGQQWERCICGDERIYRGSA